MYTYRRKTTRYGFRDAHWQAGYMFTSDTYDDISVFDKDSNVWHANANIELIAVDHHGWVGYNSGPGGWFWAENKSDLEHELTDGIRPATPLEKAFFNAIGNKWIAGEILVRLPE